MFIFPHVGTRHIATISSNRWASRTPSQRIHRKNWILPDLTEQCFATDKILHYSNHDYVIGESSHDMLQEIAHRLNNGPVPAANLPQLDTEPHTAILQPRMIETGDGQRFELEGYSNPAELEARYPTTVTNDLGSSIWELEGRPRSSLSVQVDELNDLQADSEHASPSAARQARKADKELEGGFF